MAAAKERSWKSDGILLCAGAALIAAFLIWLIAGTHIELGVTGKWVWMRSPAETLRPAASLLMPCITLLVLIGLAAVSVLFVRRFPRAVTPVSLFILFCGLFLQNSLLSAGRAGRAENEAAFLDVYTGGYLKEAVLIGNASEYFASYADRMARDEDETNHLDVHPPANIFFCLQIVRFARNSCIPARIACFVQPPETRRILRGFLRDGVFRGMPDDPCLPDAAALLLLLSQAAVFLSSVLVFLALRRLCPVYRDSEKMIAAALFLSVVSVEPLLFAGHFDVFMNLIGAVCLTLLVYSITARSLAARRIFAFAAGTAVALGCSSTLAFGLMIPAAAILFLLRKDWRKGVDPFLFFALGGSMFAGLVFLLAGVNLPECAFYARRNNGRFFQEINRGYLEFIHWNILDLLMFGTPLAVLAALFRAPAHGTRRFYCSRRNVTAWCFMLLAFSLAFSPSLRGEVGRILLFASSGLLLTAACGILRMNVIPWRIFSAAVLLQGILLAVMRVFLRIATIW